MDGCMMFNQGGAKRLDSPETTVRSRADLGTTLAEDSPVLLGSKTNRCQVRQVRLTDHCLSSDIHESFVHAVGLQFLLFSFRLL